MTKGVCFVLIKGRRKMETLVNAAGFSDIWQWNKKIVVSIAAVVFKVGNQCKFIFKSTLVTWWIFPLICGTDPRIPVLTALNWWKWYPKGPRTRAWLRRRDGFPSVSVRCVSCFWLGAETALVSLQHLCCAVSSSEWITWRNLRLAQATLVVLHSWASPQDCCCCWFIIAYIAMGSGGPVWR